MTKVKSNALWNELSPENLQILDTWFFEKKMSYAKALPKAQKQLGFKGSIGSLKRYYKRRVQERLLTTMEDVGKDAAKASNTGASPDELRQANMRVVGVCLFQALRENPEALKELMPVVKAMLQNDYNETLRESKAEDRKLRREVLAFAKERFEFDMTEKALKALPRLHELAEARKDPHLKRYEEQARRNRLRRAMFGAGQDVEPENAQEEAEMRAAKQEREARRRQSLPAQPEGERLVGPPVPSSQHYQEYVEAKAGEDAKERAREKAYAESQAQASREEQAAWDESRKQREAQALAAKQAEREKRRKYWEVRTKFEEIRELCGWQELKRPPGWGDIEGWKDAPFEWDDDDAYLEWGD